MKHITRRILLGISLLTLSAAVYFIHFLIFRDPHHIFIYLLGDIGFVFIEVLLVTIIIDEVLSLREKQALMRKLNMAIGAFFSELGTNLLKYLSNFDPEVERVRSRLVATKKWSLAEFAAASAEIKQFNYRTVGTRGDIEVLRDMLVRQRDFLLRLLENPNLLEHDSFTNLLQAVFHLTEELSRRKDVKNLGSADLKHIETDMARAYSQLLKEWLDYMKHLRLQYPYLFSFAMRTNPFDPDAVIEVSEAG
jgi:hypothetical protein